MCGCEDIDACHNFMSEVFDFIGSFSKRRFFFCIDHPVCDEEIKINYDKDQFGHLIYEYVCEILKKLKKVALVLLRGT